MRVSLAALVALAWATSAHEQETDPTWPAFRALYEELVEIDSSPTTGSCTRAAEAMATRLREGGFAAGDIHLIVPEGRPDDGNLVAHLQGSDPAAEAVLLLAHIDVVDARREDWTRDPFTLVEEGGFFYGRGVIDDKAMAAVFADLIIRLRAEGFRPRTKAPAAYCRRTGGLWRSMFRPGKRSTKSICWRSPIRAVIRHARCLKTRSIASAQG